MLTHATMCPIFGRPRKICTPVFWFHSNAVDYFCIFWVTMPSLIIWSRDRRERKKPTKSVELIQRESTNDFYFSVSLLALYLRRSFIVRTIVSVSVTVLKMEKVKENWLKRICWNKKERIKSKSFVVRNWLCSNDWLCWNKKMFLLKCRLVFHQMHEFEQIFNLLILCTYHT